MYNVYVPGYLGLGDNIYLRPIIRHILKQYGPVYLRTPFPELFEDLGIHPVKPETKLRTQKNNIRRYKGHWYMPPLNFVGVNPRYSIKTFKRGLNTIQAFERAAPIDDFDFSLPIETKWSAEYKYAVVRPVTNRTEWMANARNCKPEYIQACIEILREQGITTIGIASLEKDKEWVLGKFEPDQFYSDGLFDPKTIAALMLGSEVVVSPVGFALPMGIALNVPTFIIFGGFVPPHVLTDPRMDLSKYGYAAPDPFCRCYNRKHESCQKTIPNIEQTFTTFLSRVLKEKMSQV